MTKDQIAAKAREMCLWVTELSHADTETDPNNCGVCNRFAKALQSIADEAEAEADQFQQAMEEWAKRAEEAESYLAEARERLGEAISLLQHELSKCHDGEERCSHPDISVFLARQEAPK